MKFSRVLFLLIVIINFSIPVNAEKGYVPKCKDPVYKDESGWELRHLKTTKGFSDRYLKLIFDMSNRGRKVPDKVMKAFRYIYETGYENYWVISVVPNSEVTIWNKNSKIHMKFINLSGDTLELSSSEYFFPTKYLGLSKKTRSKKQIILSSELNTLEVPNKHFKLKETPHIPDTYLLFFRMDGLIEADQIIETKVLNVTVKEVKNEEGNNRLSYRAGINSH